MSRYLYFPTRKKLEYTYICKTILLKNSLALSFLNAALPRCSLAAYLLLFQLTPNIKWHPKERGAAEPDISRLWPSNGHSGDIWSLGQGPEWGHWTRSWSGHLTLGWHQATHLPITSLKQIVVKLILMFSTCFYRGPKKTNWQKRCS